MKTIKATAVSGGLAFAIGVFHAPANAIVVIGAGVEMQATATAGLASATRRDATTLGAALAPLRASVSAHADGGEGSVETGGALGATWAGPANGQVRFEDIGWSTTGVPYGIARPDEGAGWVYSFIADGDGKFELDWNVAFDALTTSAFGLHPFVFMWSGPDGSLAFLGNGEGHLSRVVEEGVSYTVGLRSQSNIGGALRSRSARMDGIFDWRIDSSVVPLAVPGTLVLVGTALAGLGALTGRRRRPGPSGRNSA